MIFKVKNIHTNIITVVSAETKYHAINRAIELSNYTYKYKDFKIIK